MITRSQSAWNAIALLKIVDASFRNGRESLDNIELQKLSFLSEIQGQSRDIKTAYFKFYRAKHGPYSKTLANTIADFERLGLIEQETRELRDRGRYLLRYAQPSVDQSATAIEAFNSIRQVARVWKDFKGWNIKLKLYELPVPVQGMGGQLLRMPDVPLYIDILDPETSSFKDQIPFPDELVDDIHAELSIPSARLDPDKEEVWLQSVDSLSAAFAR